MATNKERQGVIFQNIQPKGQTPPEGWQAVQDICRVWTHWTVLDLEQMARCEGIEFKRGDKTVRVTLQDLTERLGLVW